jgi:hypothetical protein
MAEAKRDVVLAWLPKGRMATGEDFEKGEPWPDFDGAIIHAHEAARQDSRVAWIRCDKKFVLSPEDIAAAYPEVKGQR